MALTKEDLQAISDLMDVKLQPVKEDLSEVKEDVAVLKKDVSELKEDVSVLKVEMLHIDANAQQ